MVPARLIASVVIHTVNADGSGRAQVLRSDEDEKRDWYPAWSPGGTRIAYTSDVVGNGSIFIARVDGPDPRPILVGESGRGAFDPAWSPDGKWIALAREVDANHETDLYLIRPDGTGLRKLLERPGTETDPSWSPD